MRLLQLSVGLEHVGVNPVPREYGNVEASIHLPSAAQLAGSDAYFSRVGAQVQRWIPAGRSSAAGKLRAPHLGNRGLIVRASGVRPLQIGLQRQRCQSLIGSLLGQYERLPKRKANDSCHAES